MKSFRRTRAFALVLTLALVALLTLVVIGLGLAHRIGSELERTALAGVRARQHARLALDAALAELQRLAGPDDAVSGMAGITGVPPGAGNPARHWCGVWGPSGEFRGWLASGATGPLLPNLGGTDAIDVLSDNALGADGVDKEHVRALMHPILIDIGATSQRLGTYAWWIGDEGVKLSARLTAANLPAAGVHAIDELIPAMDPLAANLSRVEAYGQLAFVPSPALTPGQLQASFHAISLEHAGADALGAMRSGLLNVNTTTVRFWRGVAATYNRLKPATATAIDPAAFAVVLRDEIPAGDAANHKPAGGPFPTVADFLASVALGDALTATGGDADDFAATMQPWLCTRSGTFRVRGYGDVRASLDSSSVEAVAWCEAIVERSVDPLPGFGRRFVIRSFRWLGPDDL